MSTLIITLVLAAILPANVATLRILVRVHPRRRAIAIALIVIGNAMWLFFPISRTSRLETTFATATAQKPDVILLAGDNIDDDPFFTTKLLAATGVLDPRMPLIAVRSRSSSCGGAEQTALLRRPVLVCLPASGSVH